MTNQMKEINMVHIDIFKVCVKIITYTNKYVKINVHVCVSRMRFLELES